MSLATNVARKQNLIIAVAIVVAALVLAPRSAVGQQSLAPGARTVTDAHNCYPYDGKWMDRIDRALSTGVPVAIEQDMNWYVPPNGGAPRAVVAHGDVLSGAEPGLEEYFFDRIRPLVEAALNSPDHSQWPLIVLNLDFKSNRPELLHAVWTLLEAHRDWLTTARKTADGTVQPWKLGPVLVLNGPADEQQKIFYDEVPVGEQLLTFGAVHTNMHDITASSEAIESEPASNYRRWWNNPWSVVEANGQPKAGAWTRAKQMRLKALVDHAHRQGLWIRFYTLDGASAGEMQRNGWFHQYNFGSLAAAQLRWKAAIAARVDYIATDQYEELGTLVHHSHR